MATQIIGTKKELLEALEGTNDNDIVVVEVHDTILTEDLYSFYVDIIGGIELENGELVNEIRFTAIPYEK
jgi:hypothetical protein